MGELKIVLPEDVEQAFRRAAMWRFGYQKGAMSKAARDALQQWSGAYEEVPQEKDVWGSLEGALKHVKKSSVELQHEAWDYIAQKYMKKKVKKRAHRR